MNQSVAQSGKSVSRYTETERLIKWRKYTDLPLVVLAIGSLPILLLELVSNRLNNFDKNFIIATNIFIFVAFAADYIVEIFSVKEKAQYAKAEWSSLLICIAQFVAIVPAFAALGFLRGARATRVVTTAIRIFALSVGSQSRLRQMFHEHAAGLAFGAAGFTFITSAVAFTLVEDVGEGGRINSFFDALWWSAATITTVGYGDIYPVTAVGRIIAVFTMVVGISTLAVVTARIAQFLISADNAQV